MKSLTVNDILKFEKSHKLKERSIYGINYWYCRRTRTLNDIISTACGQQGMCCLIGDSYKNVLSINK